jgi:hypothetical protein
MPNQYEFLDELINKKYLQDKTDSPIQSALANAEDVHLQHPTLQPPALPENWSVLLDHLQKGSKI